MLVGKQKFDTEVLLTKQDWLEGRKWALSEKLPKIRVDNMNNNTEYFVASGSTKSVSISSFNAYHKAPGTSTSSFLTNFTSGK